MTNEQLLDIAKNKYPVGTKFRIAHIPDAIRTVKSHEKHKYMFYEIDDERLHLNFLTEENPKDDNCASVYSTVNGWAEVVEYTQLPETFGIRQEPNNPLWDKYIKWLNPNLLGDVWRFYGRVDVDESHCDSESLVFKETILTLEQWDKVVNILPERYCVKNSEEVTNYAQKSFEPRICNFQPHNPEFYLCVDTKKKGYSAYHFYYLEEALEQKYTEISQEEFKKYVLKVNKIEKEIVGYKLKTEFSQYYKVINLLTGYDNFNFEGFVSSAYLYFNQSVKKLKEVGILDLWFEPVYKNSFDLKDGDYIWLDGDMVQITKIIPSDYFGYWIKHTPKASTGGGFGYNSYEDVVRKATPEEVEIVNLKINDYKIELHQNGIKVGCEELTW